MLPAEIIRAKRDGHPLPPASIQAFIQGYVSGQIPDYQAAALLMPIFFRGISPTETAALTRAMMHSGRTYHLASERPLIDKHSTGGIGDKVSLPLAPLAAACGLAVPMVRQHTILSGISPEIQNSAQLFPTCSIQPTRRKLQYFLLNVFSNNPLPTPFNMRKC